MTQKNSDPTIAKCPNCGGTKDAPDPFGCEAVFHWTDEQLVKVKSRSTKPTYSELELRQAEAQLLEELGLSFHRVGNSLQVTLFEPFKLESLVPADKSYTAHFAMDKAWKKLVESRAELARVLGLLQRISEAWSEIKFAGVGNDLHCTADRHYVSEIDDALAESADIGKLDTADKSAKKCFFCGRHCEVDYEFPRKSRDF